MAFRYRAVALAATVVAALAGVVACTAEDVSSVAPTPASDAAASDGCGGCGDSALPLPTVDASVCHPADLSSWAPPAYHPASGAAQGKCDAAQIQAFYDACFGPKGTHDACAAVSKNDACAACLVTTDDQPKYGPVVTHGTLAAINFAGCIELLDANGLACAKYVQAADACEVAACSANCPVTNDTTVTAYEGCAAEAAKGACASFVTSAACASRQADAAAAAGACDPAQPFEQAFFAIAPIFCGAPAGDAAAE